jgi:calcipressin-2
MQYRQVSESKYSLQYGFDNIFLCTANARIQLHQFKIDDSIINCYFAQPVTPVSNKNLQPPAPTKQFLISPPSSPPAGWAQAEELEPIVNQDLLAALANLMPGEVHELHAAGESQPSIVVHTAIVQETLDEGSPKQSVRAIPTKCPERA